jgi:ring-1,2-phenylacetyl-CoA epoxidase subunit PaaA
MKWKIKRFSNDELRQRFVDMTVPQAELLGIDRCQTPTLKWNEESGHYEYGAIDWSEFENVIAGNGPCNKERLEATKGRPRKWRVGARGGSCIC